jgi:hypothetical protein
MKPIKGVFGGVDDEPHVIRVDLYQLRTFMTQREHKGTGVLTVKAAAARACVCEKLVRGWITSGQLPHFRVGSSGKRGKILIEVADLDVLLESFKVAGRASMPASKSARTVKLRHLKLS